MNTHKNTKKRNRRIALLLIILACLLYWFLNKKPVTESVKKKETPNMVKGANCYPNVIISEADSTYMDNPNTHERTITGKKTIVQNGCHAVPMRNSEAIKDTLISHANNSTPLRLKRSGWINYNKRHKIGQDIINADTIYVLVKNALDLTSEVSKYSSFKKQSSYLNRLIVKAYLGYNKRFIQSKMLFYAEDDYLDKFPKPHITIEVYIKQFELSKGRTRRWQKTFVAETMDGKHLSTDIVWWEKYIKAKYVSEFHIMDNNCNLIVKRTEETEHTDSFSWNDIYGDPNILPRAYRNSFDNLRPVLREDEHTIMRSLRKILTETMGRTGSHLNSIALKRLNINK
jgi:hypothetical protein